MKKIILCLFLSLSILFTNNTYAGIFDSMEKCLENGDYQSAYKKAKKQDDKDLVIAESIMAKISSEIKDSFKDPSSYLLRSGCYLVKQNNEKDPDVNSLVLEIGGRNSFGGMTSNVYLFEYLGGKYNFIGSVADLENEETNKYDSYSEISKKEKNNELRKKIKDIIRKSKNVSKDSLKRVNALISNSKIDKAKFNSN